MTGKSGTRLGLAALLLSTQVCRYTCSAQEQLQSLPPITSAGLDSRLNDARKSIAAADFARSRAQLTAYLKQNENSADAHFLLAYSLLRLNEPKASLAEYTRAAQLRRPSAEDLRYVAEDYALLDDYEEAERWMKRSVQMNPADADSWYGLGRIQYSRQTFPLALESFQKALTLAPNSVKVENNLALTYENLNREDDAVAAYRKALEWQKDAGHPSEQPMLNLAAILIRRCNLDEAEGLLTQAVAIAPKDSKIRDQLGRIYIQREQYDKAQLEYEQAVAIAPDDASFHFFLGRVYRHQGMMDKAEVEFARAATLKGRKSAETAPSQPSAPNQ
jgi:tetratricopeptide (TPR) repeat protein